MPDTRSRPVVHACLRHAGGVSGKLVVTRARTAARIEAAAARQGAYAVGRVCYDPMVTQAQVAGRTLIEAGPGKAARDVREVWERLQAARPHLQKGS